MKKKIEAVVVCVNYSDFLAHTLPTNKHLFDKVVVVTDSKDVATKNLCEHYHVECVLTDVFYEDGNAFNKAKGINEGLKHLDKDGWVVQLDADIYLPPMTRFILERMNLDETTIYSIDRLMCPSYEAWTKYVNAPTPIHEGWIYVHLDAFPIGVRIAEYMSDGWEPIGFFQMWHPIEANVHEYSADEKHSADRTDVLHTKKFSRHKRQLIPELVCIHLDSELNPEMGKNWKGRKTKKFGPISESFMEISDGGLRFYGNGKDLQFSIDSDTGAIPPKRPELEYHKESENPDNWDRNNQRRNRKGYRKNWLFRLWNKIVYFFLIVRMYL